MDDDGDMIRVVESHCAAIECSSIEAPLRRSGLPDQPRKFAPIFIVTRIPALGGKVKLIPPIMLIAVAKLDLEQGRGLRKRDRNRALWGA